MVNRNSPSKFKSNEVDAPMPVSSEGLRTTDETGIGQRIRRTADNDETLTINLFPGQFIRGIFLYWPELLVILLVKFLLCYFGILTGLIERCSYFARDLCPKYWPELLVTPLVNLLLCYEPFPTGVKQRDQPATIDFAMAALNSDINIWKEVPDTFISVTQGCQARKGSSCDQACLTSLRHEVGTISRLERSAIKSTLAREYFDRDLGPKLFVIDRCVSQSHVLESYIHPEMTEVGTLPSLGTMRITCVGNIPIFYGLLELLGYDWILNLLQYLNFWKKSDTHNSSRPTNNCWMPDAVNFLLLTSSMRYPESQRSINLSEGCLKLFETQKSFVQIIYGLCRRHYSILKEAPDISSSWHPACSACFMPGAENIPHLEGCLNLSESQKNFGHSFNGPISSATQARQPDSPLLEDRHASQSYVLEPYFHPEITEVGTLPSLGAVQVTVGNIQIADGVGQKRRDFEEMAWSAFLQGYRRDFTAASHFNFICLQDFCPIVTDGECSTPVEIAAEYFNCALIIHSSRSPHLLVEVTLVSRQKDLLVV